MTDGTILSTNVGVGDTIQTHDKGAFKVASSVIDVGGSGVTEAIIGDTGVFMPVEGAAAENAAAAGNPVLGGGRFDTSPRTLGTGDVGAFAIDVSGAIILGAGTAEIGKLAAGVAEIGNVKNSGTFTVQEDGDALTSLQLLDNAVSGSGYNISQLGGAAVPIGAGVEATAVRVTLPTDGTGVVILGAGTATIGKLAANSGVDIGDVDVTSVIPGVGATDLGKAEDAVHSSGDTGVMILAVRNDGNTAISADGDYTPLNVNESGSLWTHEEPNFVDPTNSSTTPLGIGGVFTGTATEVLDFSAVTINIDSDVDSATDGVQLQLSSDGTNWDVDRPFNYLTADGGALFQQATAAKFFRIVYTNGGTGQAHFRLQTILHHTTPISGTHRLADDEDPDGSTGLVKAAIIAQAAGSGDFKPVQSTAGGNLKVSIEESNGDITGPGTEAQALRVTIATDSTGLLSIDDNGGSLTVDNGGTFATQATLQTGTNDVGNVGQAPQTSGGYLINSFIGLATTNEVQIKATAGQFFGFYVSNTNAAPVFLKVYNDTAANVVVGADVPVLRFMIPGNTAGVAGAQEFLGGIEFDTAITVAVTAGIADTDTTAVSANEQIVNILFK